MGITWSRGRGGVEVEVVLRALVASFFRRMRCFSCDKN